MQDLKQKSKGELHSITICSPGPRTWGTSGPPGVNCGGGGDILYRVQSAADRDLPAARKPCPWPAV